MVLRPSSTCGWHLRSDAFDLVQVLLVGAPVVELRSPGRGVVGDSGGAFQRAAVLEVGGDAGGMERAGGGWQVEDAYAGFVSVQPRQGKVRLQPRLGHAYAGTAYTVQGRTCEATVYCGFTAADARALCRSDPAPAGGMAGDRA